MAGSCMEINCRGTINETEVHFSTSVLDLTRAERTVTPSRFPRFPIDTHINNTTIFTALWLVNLKNMHTIPLPNEEVQTQDRPAPPDPGTTRAAEGAASNVADRPLATDEPSDTSSSDGGSELSELGEEDMDEIIMPSRADAEKNNNSNATGGSGRSGLAGEINHCRSLFKFVKHRKSKYKIEMTDGVIQVNGKEMVFHNASTDFEWGT